MFAFLAIAGSLLSFVGARKQEKELKKAAANQQAAAVESKNIANRNAARIEAETAEEVRREKRDAQQRRDLALVKAAASGGTLTGSTGLYLDEMKDNDVQFLDWLQKSGSSKADIARREGNYNFLTGIAAASGTRAQASSAKYEGYGHLLSAGGSAWDWYKNKP